MFQKHVIRYQVGRRQVSKDNNDSSKKDDNDDDNDAAEAAEADTEDKSALAKGTGTFIDCLSPIVQEWLQFYIENWPHCVYNLGQNPHAYPVHSSPTVLQTIIKSTNLMWSHDHGRWFTPSELLMCQGFPLRAELTNGRAACSFAFSTSSNMKPRRRSILLGQAGNTMNVCVAAVVSCTEC